MNAYGDIIKNAQQCHLGNFRLVMIERDIRSDGPPAI